MTNKKLREIETKLAALHPALHLKQKELDAATVALNATPEAKLVQKLAAEFKAMYEPHQQLYRLQTTMNTLVVVEQQLLDEIKKLK